MDVCEESETFLENTENQKIEATEETAPTLHCPDEKSERSHVCCLLGVSDLTLEEDGRASECAISTGSMAGEGPHQLPASGQRRK
uniref:Isoform 2 of Uncharacterized protein C16orf46 homolog n=1 Tax=Mus musculus TaxID=10090 RepID=Q8BHB7-2|nr:1700030J22Rik protein [Mus musculus]